MAAPSFRCAIYTRKSSEEGLEQGFNSLHAQREACEAYVRSQVGEGWLALPIVYDDGGFSGGTMDRPGLAQLLNDIAKGAVDIVVVYKVDRLTRALSDFARIVEIFDKRGVSFVSVTQAFNTTSSMGRLTLNVLLSFAQFEREVTGERIRDKIAQSKAKGMWMGGNVPLGYDIPTDPNTRVLVVNPIEAETVRLIFTRYLELGTVRLLAVDLAAQRVVTKKRTTGSGRVVGGGAWQEGPLYYFLKNRIYRGDIVHKGKAYPGQHQAVVDPEIFDAVQVRLAEASRATPTVERGQAQHSLTGKIFDDRGHPMSPVSARRGGRVHRYYVSQARLRGDRGEAGTLPRVPAGAVEALVDRELRAVVDLGKVDGDLTAALIKVVVASDGIEMAVDPASLRIAAADGLVADEPLRRRVAATLKTFGGAKRMFGGAQAPVEAIGPDHALLKAIARGRRWQGQLATGERSSSQDIACAEGIHRRYVDRVLNLAWLAPDIIDAVLDGRRLRDFTLPELMAADIPLGWAQQRAFLRFV